MVPETHAVWLRPHRQHFARSHGSVAGRGAYVAEHRCAELPARPRAMRTTGLLVQAVLHAASWPALDKPGAGREQVAGVILDEVRSLRAEPLDP